MPIIWIMGHMNDLDITFDTFRSEVLNATSYAFEDAQLQEFYDDGYTVHDTIDWAEWKLDEEMFPEFS
tara:strand:- start:285 stop:488 length:204 start_codon:yes stop_codon:yes gene_type:complete